MNALVWDASAAVKLVVEETGSGRARTLFAQPVQHYTLDWSAAEVASALWKRALRSGAEPGAVLLAFDTFGKLDFRVADAEGLTGPALRLALGERHPIYDCIYIWLAMEHGAPLVTADARQASLAERVGLEVHFLG